MDPRSRVVHPPTVRLDEDNEPLIAPVYQSVKFDLDSLAETERVVRGERPGYTYSRAANPTVRQLELLVAELQGGDEALAVASGMAAVASVLLGLTRAGDHLVMFIESYKPARSFVRGLLARYGVEHTLLSIGELDALEHTLAARTTRLVLFESPTNPMNKLADIERLTGLARAHGATTVLDNTFAGLHNHHGCGVDLYVHSLTKYAAGHGDVMAGAVIGDAQTLRRLRLDQHGLGAVLDPHAAWLVSRGLRTYFVRYERQCANALEIARFLQSHRRVRRVYYPGLPEDPDHALAQRQMHDFGAIVSFELDGDAESVRRFVDALALFRLTFSLGSTESLVMPPAVFVAGDLSDEQRRIARIGPGAVRLAVGIEAAVDLVGDLQQALTAAV